MTEVKFETNPPEIETIYDFKLPTAKWIELRTKRFEVTSDKFVPGGEFRDFWKRAIYVDVNGETAECDQFDAGRIKNGDVIILSSLFLRGGLREQCAIADILDTYPNGHYFDVYAPNMRLAQLVKVEMQKKCSAEYAAFYRLKSTWSVAIFGRYQETGCTQWTIRVTWGRSEAATIPIKFDPFKNFKELPAPKVLTVQEYFDLGFVLLKKEDLTHGAITFTGRNNLIERSHSIKSFDLQLINTLYGACDTIFCDPNDYNNRMADYEALIRYRVFEFIEMQKKKKHYPIVVPAFHEEVHSSNPTYPREEKFICSVLYSRKWNRIFHELELPKLVERGFVTYSNF